MYRNNTVTSGTPETIRLDCLPSTTISLVFYIEKISNP